MAAEKKNICYLLSFLMIFFYLRTAKTTNIDCSGKPFHCINSTHFMICVDLGAGVLKTVDDYVIQCPPSTVCSENNNFECEYKPPTTTESIIRLSDETKLFEINTKTSTIEPFQKTSVTDFFSEYINTVSVTTQTNLFKDLHKEATSVDTTETSSNTNNISGVSDINFDNLTTTIEPYIVNNTNKSYVKLSYNDTSIVDNVTIKHNETSKIKTKDFMLRDVAERPKDSTNHSNNYIILPTTVTFDQRNDTDSMNEMSKEPITESLMRKNSQNIIKISPLELDTITAPKGSNFDDVSSTTQNYIDTKNNIANTEDNMKVFLTKSEIQTDKPMDVNVALILPNYTAVHVTNYTKTERFEWPSVNVSEDTEQLLESNISEINTRNYLDETSENKNVTIRLEYLPANMTDKTIIAKPTENYKLRTPDKYTSDMYFPNMTSSVQLVNITFSLPSLTITEPTTQNSTPSMNITKSSVDITTQDKKIFLPQSEQKTVKYITSPPNLIAMNRSASTNTNNEDTTPKTAESTLMNTILGPAVNRKYTSGNNLVYTTIEPTNKYTEYLAHMENSTESVAINTILEPNVKSTENNTITESVRESALINIVELTNKSTEYIAVTYNATEGPLVDKSLKPIAKPTEDYLVINNAIESASVSAATETTSKSAEHITDIKYATESDSYYTTIETAVASTDVVITQYNALTENITKSSEIAVNFPENSAVPNYETKNISIDTTLGPTVKFTEEIPITKVTESALYVPISKSTEDIAVTENATKIIADTILEPIEKSKENILLITYATESPSAILTFEPTVKSFEDIAVTENVTEKTLINITLQSKVKFTEDVAIPNYAIESTSYNTTVQTTVKFEENMTYTEYVTEASSNNTTLEKAMNFTEDIVDDNYTSQNSSRNTTLKPTEYKAVRENSTENAFMTNTLHPTDKSTDDSTVTMGGTENSLINATIETIEKSTEDFTKIVNKILNITKSSSEIVLINTTLQPSVISTKDFTVSMKAAGSDNTTSKLQVQSIEDIKIKKTKHNAKSNSKFYELETEIPVNIDFTTRQFNLITPSEKINIPTTQSILSTNIETTMVTTNPLRKELTEYPYTAETKIPEKITEINTLLTKNLNTEKETFLENRSIAIFASPFLNTSKLTTKSIGNVATIRKTKEKASFKTKDDKRFSVDVTTKLPSTTTKRATKYVTIETHESPNMNIKDSETHLLMEIPQVRTESDKIVSIENQITRPSWVRNKTEEIIAVNKVNMSTSQDINLQKMPSLNVSIIENLKMDTLLINTTSFIPSLPPIPIDTSTKLYTNNVLTKSTFSAVFKTSLDVTATTQEIKPATESIINNMISKKISQDMGIKGPEFFSSTQETNGVSLKISEVPETKLNYDNFTPGSILISNIKVVKEYTDVEVLTEPNRASGDDANNNNDYLRYNNGAVYVYTKPQVDEHTLSKNIKITPEFTTTIRLDHRAMINDSIVERIEDVPTEEMKTVNVDTMMGFSSSDKPILSKLNSKQTFEEERHSVVPESKEEQNETVFSPATYTLMTDNNLNKKDNNTTEPYIVTTMPATDNIIRFEEEIKVKSETLEIVINKLKENGETKSTVEVYSNLTHDKNTTVFNDDVKKDDKHYKVSTAVDKNITSTQTFGNLLSNREFNFGTVSNNLTNSDIQTILPIFDTKIVSFQKVDYNNSTQNINKISNKVNNENVSSDIRISRDVYLRNQSIELQNNKNISFDTRYKLDSFKEIYPINVPKLQEPIVKLNLTIPKLSATIHTDFNETNHTIVDKVNISRSQTNVGNNNLLHMNSTETNSLVNNCKDKVVGNITNTDTKMIKANRMSLLHATGESLLKQINNNHTSAGQTDFTFKSRHDRNVVKIGDNSSANKFTCEDRFRGKYSDTKDCRKFYICIGKIYPLLRECPLNTVFSEINKQCTKNLSHCIRNNQFHCTQEGRFSDALKSNIYYICVKNKNAYVRFQFQCQSGYYLNKANVRCIINEPSKSRKSSTSIDSDSTKVSDQSTVERKQKEKKQNRTNIQKHYCRKEGKFPDPDNCRRYYVCSRNSKSEFRRRSKKCESDEVFHREKEICVDSESYECNV